jgi:hypothetical protein
MIDANPTHFQADVIEASHDQPVLVDLLSLDEWPRAAEVLRTVLAPNPSLDAVRATYVHALLRQGDATLARHGFEPLRARAPT